MHEMLDMSIVYPHNAVILNMLCCIIWIYSKYYMYRFVGDTFLVSQCTNEFKNIYTNEEFILFDYISGYFKQDKKGIKIVMKVKKEKNYIRELKDYALKGRKW